jgi:hypothetical protein
VAKRTTAAAAVAQSDRGGGLVRNVGKLLGRQVDPPRSEVRREVHGAEGAALEENLT